MESSGQGAPQERRPLRDLWRAAQKPVLRARAPGRGPPPPAATTQPPIAVSEAATASGQLPVTNAGAAQDGNTAVPAPAAAAASAPIHPRPPGPADVKAPQPEPPICGTGEGTLAAAATSPDAPAPESAVLHGPCNGAVGRSGGDGTGGQTGPAVYGGDVAAPADATAIDDRTGRTVGGGSGAGAGVAVPAPAQVPGDAAAGVAASSAQPTAADEPDASVESPARQRAAAGRLLPTIAPTADAAASTRAAAGPKLADVASTQAAAVGGSGPATAASLGLARQPTDAAALPLHHQPQAAGRNPGSGALVRSGAAASAGARPPGGDGAGGERQGRPAPRPFLFKRTAKGAMLKGSSFFIPMGVILKEGLRSVEELGPISAKSQRVPLALRWGDQTFTFVVEVFWSSQLEQVQKQREQQLGRQQQKQQQKQQPDLNHQEQEGQPGRPQGGRPGGTSAVAGEQQLAQGRGGAGGEARAAAAVAAPAPAAADAPVGVFIRLVGVLFAQASVQEGDTIRFKRLKDASYCLTFTAPDGSIRTPPRAGTAAEAAANAAGDADNGRATAAAAGGGGAAAAAGRNTAAADVGPGAPGADAAADVSTVRVGSSNGITAPDASCGRGEVAPSDRASNETAGDMSTTSGGAERRLSKGRAAACGEVEYCPEDCGDCEGSVEGEAEQARRPPAAYGATAAGGAAIAAGTAAGEVPFPFETRGSVPALRGAAAVTGPVLAAAAAAPQTDPVAINTGGAAAAAAAAGATGPATALPPAKKPPGKDYPVKASSGGSGGRAVAAKQATVTAAALQAAAAVAKRVTEPGTDAGAAGPGEGRGAANKAAQRVIRSEQSHCKVLTACSWSQNKITLNRALMEPGGVFEGLPAGAVLMQEAGGTGRWMVRHYEASGSSQTKMKRIKDMLRGLGLSKADCASQSVQLRFERIDLAAAGSAGSSGHASSPDAGTKGDPPVAAFTVQVHRLAGGPMPTAGAGAGKAAAAPAQQQQQPPVNKQKRKTRETASPPASATPAAAVVGARAGLAGAGAGKRASDGPAQGSVHDGQVANPGQEQGLGLALPPSDSYRAAASTLTLAHLRSHSDPRQAAWPAAASAVGLGLAGGGGSGQAVAAHAAAELNLFGVVFPAGPVAARARAAAASWLARKDKVAAGSDGGGGGSPAGDWEVPGLDAQGRTRPGWPRKAWHALFEPDSDWGQGSPPAPLSVAVLQEGLRGLLEQRLQHEERDGGAQGGPGSGAGASASAGGLSPTGPLHLGCLRPCRDEERGGLGVCTEAPVPAGAPLGVPAGYVLEGRRAGPWDAGADGGGGIGNYGGGGCVGGDEDTADAAVYVRDGFQWVQDKELMPELRRRGGSEPENAWQFMALSYQFPYPDELSDAAALWSGGAAGPGRSHGSRGRQSQPQQAQQAKAHVLCMLGHGNVLSLLNDARPMTLELAMGNQPAPGGLDGHAIQSNCVVIPVAYLGVVLPVVVALRPLQPGEQLLADYGDGWWRELASVWELVAAGDLSPQDLLHDPESLKAPQPPLPPQPQGKQQQQQQPPPASMEPSTTSVGGINGVGGLHNTGEAEALPHTEEPQQQQGAQEEKQQRPEARPEGQALDGDRAERQGRGDQGQEGPERKRRRSRSPERPRGDRAPAREGEQDRRRGRDGDGDGKRDRSRSQGPRDRDRGRERTWERNRERNGDRDRGRGRDRDRERNHPRGPWSRSASRDRDRGGRERDRDRGRDGRPRDHRDRDPRDGRHARDRAREPSRDRSSDKGRSDPERVRDRDRAREHERPRDRDHDRQGDREREQERRKVVETRGPSAEQPRPAEPAAMGPPDGTPSADIPSGAAAVAAAAAAGGADGEGRSAAAAAGAVMPAAGGEPLAKRLRAEDVDRVMAGAPMSGAASAAASAGAGRAAVMGWADDSGPAASGAAVPSGRGASQQGGQQSVQPQPQGPRSLWPGSSQGPVLRESDPGWSPINTPRSGSAGGVVCSPFASRQPAPADAAAAAGVPGEAPPQPPPGVGLPPGQLLPYSASGTSSAAVATGMLPAPPPLPPLPAVLPAAAAAASTHRDRKRPSSRERAAPAAMTADLPTTGPSPPSPYGRTASGQSGKECPTAFATTRGLEPGQGPDTGPGSRLGHTGGSDEGSRPQPLRGWPREQQPLPQPGAGSSFARSVKPAPAVAAAAVGAGGGGRACAAMQDALATQAFADNAVGGGAKTTLAPGSLGFDAEEPYGMEGDVNSSAADRPGVSVGGARREGGAARGKKPYAPYSCPYRSKRDESLPPPPAMPDLGWEKTLLQRMAEVSVRADPLVPASVASAAAPGEGISDMEDGCSPTLDGWWRELRLQRLRRQAARAAAAAAAGQPIPRVSARPLPDHVPR